MERYDPKRKELSARDVVARAMYTELIAGRGTPNGAVYLDIRHRGPEYINKKLPSMYSKFLEFAGVEITEEKMEVAPTIHYQMGDVRVDPNRSQTTLKGIYTACEVACDLHAANRLGGNSLSDILVFGKRAGASAAEYCQTVPSPSLEEADAQKGNSPDPFSLHRVKRDQPVRAQG